MLSSHKGRRNAVRLFQVTVLLCMAIEGNPPAAAAGGGEKNERSETPPAAPARRGKSAYGIENKPAHQWIVLQAYWKARGSGADGELADELAEFLPTDAQDAHYQSGFKFPAQWALDDDAPFEAASALIEGVAEEDTSTYALLGLELEVPRPVYHFWNPKKGYNQSFSPSFIRSALEVGNDHFHRAVEEYGKGNKGLAYYWLGRAAHLVADLSVPAHALVDPHADNKGSAYETFIGADDRYRAIAHDSPNTGIPDVQSLPPYPGLPPEIDPDLARLLAHMAEKSNDFDSDESGGTDRYEVPFVGEVDFVVDVSESYRYGRGKYTRKGTQLDPGKTVERADLYEINAQNPIDGEYLLTLVRYDDQDDEFNPAPTPQYDIFKNGPNHYVYYYDAFFETYKNDPNHYVRVVFTDGAFLNDRDWTEGLYAVDAWVLEEIHQKELYARAIGHTAALFRLFWKATRPPAAIPEPNWTLY